MKFFVFLFAIAFLTATSVLAATEKKSNRPQSNLILSMSAKIYPKETFPESCKEISKGVKCTEKSYGTFHVDVKKEGELTHSYGTFSDPQSTQAIEESWEKDGHVQKAVIENRVLQKRSELEVKGDKVIYSVTNLKDGSVETTEDDWDENLVVPSTLLSYVRPHFEELKAGKEVGIRMAVLDRKESFGFTISKDRDEKTKDGDSLMVLKMKPNSIIIRALVEPIYFYVKNSNGELYAFEGESALRKKVGDEYKKMSVWTQYDVKVNAFKGTEEKATASAAACDSIKAVSGKLTKCEAKAHE